MKVRNFIKVKAELIKNGKIIKKTEAEHDGCINKCRINASAIQ